MTEDQVNELIRRMKPEQKQQVEYKLREKWPHVS